VTQARQAPSGTLSSRPSPFIKGQSGFEPSPDLSLSSAVSEPPEPRSGFSCASSSSSQSGSESTPAIRDPGCGAGDRHAPEPSQLRVALARPSANPSARLAA